MNIPELILQCRLHTNAADIALGLLPEERPIDPDESARIVSELRTAVAAAESLHERAKGHRPPIVSRL